ncbi:MAG: hypothetical protein ABSA26_14160 [Thermoguttaceae bacterium]
MNTSSQMPPEPWNNNEPPMPDPLHMTMAMDRIMHSHAVMLMFKKLIWGILFGLQTAAIIGCVYFLFTVDSISWKLLCVGFALIAHEGIVIVVIWMLLTSLRMDMLRELKGMELQLAEFRTHLQGKTHNPVPTPGERT